LEAQKRRAEIDRLQNHPASYENLVRKELGYLRPGEKEARFIKKWRGDAMGKSIYVTCATCKGLMEVDSETGDVLKKWAPTAANPDDGDKMESALKKLEADKKKREGLLEKTRDGLANQKKKLEDAFKKEVEKVKKEGVKEKPFRPFDLD